jgi:hypothetical protein
MSGGIAGFTQCVATNPMEVTKMFYQVRTPALAAAPLSHRLSDMEHQAAEHAGAFDQRRREESPGWRCRDVPWRVQHVAA